MRNINRCASNKCTMTSKNCKLGFFRFPEDKVRATSWLIACKREDLLDKLENLHYSSYRLCGMHFPKTMFANDKGNRLRRTAFPSIFPEQESSFCEIEQERLSQEMATQTATSFEIKQEHLIQEMANQTATSFEIKQEHLIQEMDDNQIATSIEIKQEPLIQEMDDNQTATENPSSLSAETHIKMIPVLFKAHRQTQTCKALSLDSPRIKKLKTSLKSYQNKNFYLETKMRKLEQQIDSESYLENITLDQYKRLTYKFCNEKLATIINVQVSADQKKPKGRRYTNQFKDYCLTLYFCGPKLYKQQLVHNFCLPSVPTLHRHIRQIHLSVGINKGSFDMLKQKISNFPDMDKLCLLCVDEMKIKGNLFYGINSDEIIGFEDTGEMSKESKKPTLTATVIMARCFSSKWKQSLAYYLVHSTCPATKLHEIIFNIISEMTNINLKVAAVVSDTGSNNIELSKLLDISPERPFFIHQNKKILFIFDTPHLLKALRNHLLKHNFLVNRKLVLWEFIKKFYEHDKQYSLRAAPKLTDSHIFPSRYKKTKVKFAAQVFSATVAAGMNLYLRFDKLPPETQPTIEFVSCINNLFDMLNSSYSTEAYRGTETQKQFLLQCAELFNNIEVIDSEGVDVTKSIKCIRGWQITINGIIHLWEMLKSNGMKYLLTRRVNQDCLESFFRKIRRQNGNCVNPTPIQFERTFRNLFCFDMIHSGTENCKNDNDKVLLNMANWPTNTSESTTTENIITNTVSTA